MDRKIKALVMDVDGTLTDGSLYIGCQGECMKQFHVKDGYAIRDILPDMGIIPIIITGRKSEIVSCRCKELGIVHVIQDSINKVLDMKKILVQENVSLEETAYIGDDINDLSCMMLVRLVGCPRNAVQEVKQIAHYVSNNDGGYGAVREFIEWIRNGE